MSFTQRCARGGFRNRGMASLRILALSLAGVPAASMAAPAGDSRGTELEEVTVTATKLGETRLQDTAMSITAFSSELLEDLHATSMTELTGYIPNVMFQNEASNFMAFIRGVGSTNVSFGGEQSVGFYLDGVYLDRGDAANVNFFDVERIEVLRGPQGTLYGRNTTGGTVNVITRRPSNEPEAEAGITVGNYSKMKFDATVSGQIVKDRIKGRLSVSDSKHDGYLENVSTGQDEFAEDYTGWRGALDIEASDAVSIEFGADYFAQDAHILGEKLVVLGGLPAMFAGGAGLSESTLIPSGFWQRYIDKAQNRDVTFWGARAKVEYRLPNEMVLTSTTGYRDYSQHDTDADIDATPLDILLAELKFETSTFTEELQLVGNAGGNHWIVGAYYLDSTNDYPRVAIDFPFIIPGLVMTRVASLDTKAWAGFANITHDFSEKLAVDAGIRYSREDKSLPHGYRQTTNIPFPPFGPLLIEFKDSWDAVTWKLGLNYRPREDAFLYAVVSTGFKAGSFSVLNPPDRLSLDPERLTSYEAGFKTEWYGKRLRLNGAVFFYDYTDLQVNTFFPPDVTLVDNAAKSRIYGGELELLARPVPELTLFAAISHLDAKYDKYIATDGNGNPVDVSGNQMPYAPEWKANFGAQYSVPVGDYGTLTARGNLSWIDDTYFDHFENRALSQRSYSILDVNVKFETTGGHWSFDLYGNNLAATEYFTYKRDALGAIAGLVGAPRTYGLQLNYRY